MNTNFEVVNCAVNCKTGQYWDAVSGGFTDDITRAFLFKRLLPYSITDLHPDLVIGDTRISVSYYIE